MTLGCLQSAKDRAMVVGPASMLTLGHAISAAFAKMVLSKGSGAYVVMRSVLHVRDVPQRDENVMDTPNLSSAGSSDLSPWS